MSVVEELVAEVGSAHGRRLTVRGRYPSGRQGGAWSVVDGDGAAAVLKWGRDLPAPRMRELAGAVASARAAGYPTPAWLASGVTSGGSWYCLQDVAPGVPSTPLTPATVPLLVEVLERQAGLAPDLTFDWNEQVRAMVSGADGDGHKRAVRALGPEGRALVERYDDLLAAYDRVELPAGDLVHGDFNTCNVLLDGGTVSGVIDVMALGVGSRVVDYACLLREAYVEGYGDGVTRRLHEAAAVVAGPAPLALCVAATAFFIVGFKRRHEPDALPRVLTRLHHLADALGEAGP
ncbi:MAG: phosphotransferase [Streptosporangiales bacterium]|nr:phosphotransferase [Streptosporangiales bacterium]